MPAGELPLQLPSATKSSNRALNFREKNNHLTKEWGQFCKFMFLKIKETAIAISVFRKFWNSLTSVSSFRLPWLKPKFPDFSLTWKNFRFPDFFPLTVATLKCHLLQVWLADDSHEDSHEISALFSLKIEKKKMLSAAVVISTLRAKKTQLTSIWKCVPFSSESSF